VAGAGTGLSAAAMCCYGKQGRKFLSWLPKARSRSRGIQVKPDDVGDLGDQLGIGGEFERLGAPGLDSVVAPHPCHRAVADSQMPANSRELQCVTPYFFGGGASVTEIRLSRSRVRGRPERSSSDLTYPPSP
jgi:hypothetical protein